MGTDQQDSSREESPGSRRRLVPRWVMAGVLVAAAGTAVAWYWSYRSTHLTTDDAQIEGHVHAVSARVAGTIIRVNVEDNQPVKAGEVVAEIDPAEYEVVLEQAKASLATAKAALVARSQGVPITSTSTTSRLSDARANLEGEQASLAAAQGGVSAAEARRSLAEAQLEQVRANEENAARDLERMKRLIAKDEISQQRYDAAVAAAKALAAGVKAAEAGLRSARQAVAVARRRVEEQRARVAQAQADLDAAGTGPQQVAESRARAASARAAVKQAEAVLRQAKLNLSYTAVKAPVAGVVATKAVEVGQVVRSGQPLLAVVELNDTWAVAKFKETKLKNMRVGQRAMIAVDAYGGKTYEGVVDSISPGTAARFSLLPPENATGNFVKVVQRVPVKIRLKRGQDPGHLLRPGMSVIATVITR